jgi:hypothetical protein
MSKSSLLESLEKESHELALELSKFSGEEIIKEMTQPGQKFDVWKVVGFKIPGSKVLVPYNMCGISRISPYALLPMYDCLLFPITSSFYWSYETKNGEAPVALKIRNDKIFRMTHGLSPQELAYLAEKEKIIPIFENPYPRYDEKTVKPLLQPGIPRLSLNVKLALEMAIVHRDKLKLGESFEKHLDSARKDMCEIFGISDPKRIKVCEDCLGNLYAKGMRDSIIRADITNPDYICLINSLPFSQELGAVLQSDCKWTNQVLASWSGLPRPESLEMITRGLKVMYGQDIPLDSYLDILDSKTTAAVRSIVRKLLEDPLSRKYSERLNVRIFDVNQQVEELCRSRMAKAFSLVSDIAVYGGDKFVEYKSQKTIRIPKRGLQKIAEWITSKGIDISARLTGKDWAIAQLSKARCKIEKCTEETMRAHTMIPNRT